ncbi:MAG: hypothetical protein ABSD49_01400 [Candidatus Bathyarchaeia archaeon]
MMLNHPRVVVIALILVAVSTFNYLTTAANAVRIQQSGPIIAVNPSSVVIKVGDSTSVNLTLTNSPASLGKVCFGVEDFPTSGFVTTIVPPCATVQSSIPVAVLTVEATPAAAPQSFTAYVVATSGNWTGRVPISITVEPAMPAWIPWSIILVFVLILLIPLMIKKKRR